MVLLADSGTHPDLDGGSFRQRAQQPNAPSWPGSSELLRASRRRYGCHFTCHLVSVMAGKLKFKSMQEG